jgi:ankyrin repeat protein
MLECHAFGRSPVAMASGVVRAAHSIRRAAVFAALSFGVIHGNALAASDVADAAMRDDATRVVTLIAAKADVNAPQPDGSTALHWAAYHGDVKLAGALLRAHANPGAVMENGMTPLSLACENGNADLVKELLKAGADPNQILANGETPLMMAARTGRVAVMAALLEKGAKVDEKEKLRGTTALMWAAANSNTDAVRFLISKGADVSARSGTTTPGRPPYLAPPGRNRIADFINGRGITFEGVKPSSDPKAQAQEDAILAKERAYAKRSLAAFPLEKPAKPAAKKWGGLTPLQFAVREGSMETVKVLVDSGADVNQRSEFGWTALLVATQNRYYKIGVFLLDHGADPNIANEGGWTPLYIATDNRNIEGGDYPTRKPDMDHLEYIKRLFASNANPNLRMSSSTETRTIFTHQWLLEEGATPFLRAAQSGDLVLLKLLLEHGADPKIATDDKVTPLMVASGIGWVEGVTYEWSPQQTLDTVKMLLDLGADVNAQDVVDGRTALMGAAHKGRNDVIELLVQHGADLSVRDIGSRDTINSLSGLRFQAIDYADGLVRIGVQSAIAHPETSALLRKMMRERNLPVPQDGRTLASICITDLCK